jgi:transposase-like protein
MIMELRNGRSTSRRTGLWSAGRWSTNPLERVNKEIKRRARVVGHRSLPLTRVTSFVTRNGVNWG